MRSIPATSPPRPGGRLFTVRASPALRISSPGPPRFHAGAHAVQHACYARGRRVLWRWSSLAPEPGLHGLLVEVVLERLVSIHEHDRDVVPVFEEEGFVPGDVHLAQLERDPALDPGQHFLRLVAQGTLGFR